MVQATTRPNQEAQRDNGTYRSSTTTKYHSKYQANFTRAYTILHDTAQHAHHRQAVASQPHFARGNVLCPDSRDRQAHQVQAVSRSKHSAPYLAAPAVTSTYVPRQSTHPADRRQARAEMRNLRDLEPSWVRPSGTLVHEPVCRHGALVLRRELHLHLRLRMWMRRHTPRWRLPQLRAVLRPERERVRERL